MDNTQVSAADGSWFLFADWQGVTRITLPGSKVKTDANLDRPNQNKPLVVRPDGQVWSDYGRDIVPATLKKVDPAQAEYHSPDPLGGPEIAVEYAGDIVSIQGQGRNLTASGEALQLGGVPRRLEQYDGTRYNVWPDGALVVFGQVSGQSQVGLMLRDVDGSARVAWCRPITLLPNGSPGAFRERGSTWLADRDLITNVAFLLEVRDDGVVMPLQSAPAIAGPWVFAGAVWWQPDDATLCTGAALGVVSRSFTLPAAHAGPGRLLRAPGRTLFVPWHGTSILDLDPPTSGKKGKGDAELSRKHKAEDEPMYYGVESLLRPVRTGMARRGVRIVMRGCSRRGKGRYPILKIVGPSDLVTYVLAYALNDGLTAKLRQLGVSDVEHSGGGDLNDILSRPAPTTAEDIAELIEIFDTAGLSRAAGFGYLYYLAKEAAKRGLALPLTPEAEDLALAAVLSGLRGEAGGAVPPATAADVVSVAPILQDYERLNAAGIFSAHTALFVAVLGHRRFGAAAVASILALLATMNSSYATEVAQAVGQP